MSCSIECDENENTEARYRCNEAISAVSVQSKTRKSLTERQITINSIVMTEAPIEQSCSYTRGNDYKANTEKNDCVQTANND